MYNKDAKSFAWTRTGISFLPYFLLLSPYSDVPSS